MTQTTSTAATASSTMVNIKQRLGLKPRSRPPSSNQAPTTPTTAEGAASGAEPESTGTITRSSSGIVLYTMVARHLCSLSLSLSLSLSVSMSSLCRQRTLFNIARSPLARSLLFSLVGDLLSLSLSSLRRIAITRPRARESRFSIWLITHSPTHSPPSHTRSSHRGRVSIQIFISPSEQAYPLGIIHVCGQSPSGIQLTCTAHRHLGLEPRIAGRLGERPLLLVELVVVVLQSSCVCIWSVAPIARRLVGSSSRAQRGRSPGAAPSGVSQVGLHRSAAPTDSSARRPRDCSCSSSSCCCCRFGRSGGCRAVLGTSQPVADTAFVTQLRSPSSGHRVRHQQELPAAECAASALAASRSIGCVTHAL